MQRSSRLAASATVMAALAIQATPASAGVDTRHLSPFREGVAALRARADHAVGDRAGGRDVLRWGVIGSDGRARAARHGTVVRYAATLRRMITPRWSARRPNVASGAGRVTPAPALPDCTWRPESGGDYGAYNASSGARGKYQVVPSTHAAYCSELGWSPGEQDECARRVYAGQGAGAWVGC